MNVTDALSVTQLNNYIKSLMETDDFLRSVAIRGEISNFKRHTSGHLYFTLKDESSEISAVMFRTSAQNLDFAPQSGNKVTVFGRVSVYEVSGKYQIYVSAMTNDGAGALFEQYRMLLEKLRAEGLFDENKKKPIPKFPKKIGIVTSPTGAAIRDMINVTGRRFPSADILISPALVQGADAPVDLCRALGMLEAIGDCDVIIIGRGGGSIEDLWAFNDEALVRQVAACHVPIISAVGHETDTTLCDYAADLRAPTPSAAAEQAVPDKNSLLLKIEDYTERLDASMNVKINSYRMKITSHAKHIQALSPEARLAAMRAKVSFCKRNVETSVIHVLNQKRARLVGCAGKLEAVNPLALIKRGYSVVMGSGNTVVSRISDVSDGDEISVIVSDGAINAVVSHTKSI